VAKTVRRACRGFGTRRGARNWEILAPSRPSRRRADWHLCCCSLYLFLTSGNLFRLGPAIAELFPTSFGRRSGLTYFVSRGTWERASKEPCP
jgi:hypothetical protein